MRNVLRIFERQLLIFPVIVVVLASATFLFGGRCAAWQWWGSVVAVLLIPFLCEKWKTAICAAFVFVGFMLCVKACTHILVTPGWPDILEYHLPAIRLLVEGWNPITMATPEALQKFSGIDNGLMRHLFVLFMAKGCWYFCAVAYFFTKEPLDLLFPLFPILLAPVVLRVLRLFENRAWSVKLVACLILLGCITNFFPSNICFSAIVDCAVCIGGIGLILSMYEVLAHDCWDWVSLIAYSFWMCVSKQPGAASCFVFWVVLAIVLLVRSWRTWLRRLATAGSLIALLVCLVGASPYFTSMYHYGHPLYPKESGDHDRYPLCDFNDPQKLRNDDAQSMGYVGNFLNAYISPSLVRGYYCWKLNQSEFKPRCWSWDDGNGTTARYAPLSRGIRWSLLVFSLLVLILGNQTCRLVLLMEWLAIAAFPSYLLGYMRFTPWFWGGAIPLFFWLLKRWPSRSFQRGIVVVTGISIGLFVLPPAVFSGAYLLDMSYAARKFLKMEKVECVYNLEVPTLGRLPPPDWSCTEWKNGNVILMQRQIPELACAELKRVVVSKKDASQEQAYKSFYDYSFQVASDVPLERYSAYKQLMCKTNGRERFRCYPMFVLKSYTVVLWRLLGI